MTARPARKGTLVASAIASAPTVSRDALDSDGYELRRGDSVTLAPAYAKGNDQVGTIDSILYYPVSH